ncbi:hypothetical protein PUNSTDRAFT_120819 [Punctularia strigosozonata HHB-11173 SS5]|uniref:uncharacterized protein n=1 Tax=Punctularia strigosozonata (strain HHB-11173) TaxID=741275 RepID=UPI0004417B6C|nr:uncharacterized protein PUNSTDRAFT_120819 [Punctularia strigosozonata HHB-11173 SS5]EIN08482.1 hypothetical protein PUNSTDRAFT_120819 [Punctularia strigosozonata HHB-11173 SS5]
MAREDTGDERVWLCTDLQSCTASPRQQQQMAPWHQLGRTFGRNTQKEKLTEP